MLKGKCRGVEALWVGNMEDVADWNPGGPWVYLWGLCSLPVPMFFPFVPFHWHSQNVTFLFSNGQNLISVFWFCLFCFHGIYLLPSSCGETRSTARWPFSTGCFQWLLLKERREREGLFHGSCPTKIQWNSIQPIMSKNWLVHINYPLLRITYFNLSIESSSYHNKHFICLLCMPRNRKESGYRMLRGKEAYWALNTL